MVLLILYLLLAWATGVGLTFVSRLPWQLEGRLAMGLPVGFAAAATLTWLIALPFGMSAGPVVAGAVALAMLLSVLIRFTDARERFRAEAMAAAQRWRRAQALPLLILLLLAAAFFVPFYMQALTLKPGGLYAGYITIWGDWATHLSLSGYLSGARHLLPPQNPFFSGVKLTYPWLPDLFSGMLIHLGVPLTTTLPVTSGILSIALVVVFFATAQRLTGNAWAAMLGTLLFFLSGGLGFTRIFGDTTTIGGVHAGGWSFTQDGDLGLQWLNPVLAYLVPQRTTLFGFSLGLLVLSTLWYGLGTKSRREMFVAGLLLAAMPLLHTSTYMALGLLCGGIALIDLAMVAMRDPDRRTRLDRLAIWGLFFAPVVVIGLPQLLMLLPPAAAIGHHGAFGFLRLEVGWLSGWTPPSWLAKLLPGAFAAQRYNYFPVAFWILNTALLLPLFVVAFTVPWGKPELRRFLAPAWLLFLLPNFVVLQPWDWDNTKWFVWWAILASMLAGLVIFQFFRRGPLMATAGVALVAVCTLSGALDLGRAAQPQLSTYHLLDDDELAVAQWARDNTPHEDVYLTGWNNDEPILTMSQHPEVLGYRGWVWSWGLELDQRNNDVVAMMRGDASAPELLRQYSVKYVVIGPKDIGVGGPGANPDYYRSRYPEVYSSPHREYSVYKVG